MKTILAVMTILAYAVSVPTLAAETVYKWTDKSGKVHFSDQPVRDADSEEMKVTPSRPASSDESGDTEESVDDTEPAANPSAQGARQAEVEKQQQEIRKQNCEIARTTLQHNENIGRMYRVDASGERVFLSDEEREVVLNSSREGVEKWCD